MKCVRSRGKPCDHAGRGRRAGDVGVERTIDREARDRVTPIGVPAGVAREVGRVGERESIGRALGDVDRTQKPVRLTRSSRECRRWLEGVAGSGREIGGRGCAGNVHVDVRET